jgi:hypothetical protein
MQRRRFLLVWQEIDGNKTVQDIKDILRVSLPETITEEILQTLVKARFIALNT